MTWRHGHASDTSASDRGRAAWPRHPYTKEWYYAWIAEQERDSVCQADTDEGDPCGGPLAYAGAQHEVAFFSCATCHAPRQIPIPEPED